MRAAQAAGLIKPNIVLILTDDLGWQDVHCYDIDEPSPMETPNIDHLASQGVMFWQAYSPAPVCAPSRSSNTERASSSTRRHDICGWWIPTTATQSECSTSLRPFILPACRWNDSQSPKHLRIQGTAQAIVANGIFPKTTTTIHSPINTVLTVLYTTVAFSLP